MTESSHITKSYEELDITVSVSYLGIQGRNFVWETQIVGVEPKATKFYQETVNRRHNTNHVADLVADYYRTYLAPKKP